MMPVKQNRGYAHCLILKDAEVAQLVAHLLAKQKVGSSSLLFRSNGQMVESGLGIRLQSETTPVQIWLCPRKINRVFSSVGQSNSLITRRS